MPESSASAEERAALRWKVKQLREQVLRDQRERSRSDHDGIFEKSPRMKAIKQMIDQVADTDATVLVRGETGVGKELVARAIHDSSPRRAAPSSRSTAPPCRRALLESELFGHERGAFTGADRQKPGKFELADGGTLFLDEIGELPLSLQAKLLRVLQDHEFPRVGCDRDIQVDVRVIAATNRDLEAVAQRTFREDLYYRLNVVPSSSRRCASGARTSRTLAEHFCRLLAPVQPATRAPLPGSSARFQAHPWPGNVRELENFVKRVVVLESERARDPGARVRAAGRAAASDRADSLAAGARPRSRADVPPSPGLPRT